MSTLGLDPLTPTTSRTWGPLPAQADENAGCRPPSPPKGRGLRLLPSDVPIFSSFTVSQMYKLLAPTLRSAHWSLAFN